MRAEVQKAVRGYVIEQLRRVDCRDRIRARAIELVSMPEDASEGDVHQLVDQEIDGIIAAIERNTERQAK